MRVKGLNNNNNDNFYNAVTQNNKGACTINLLKEIQKLMTINSFKQSKKDGVCANV